MSIFNSAYCEPLPLDGYIFGADFDLDWTGSQFTAKWSDFVLSDTAKWSDSAYPVTEPRHALTLFFNVMNFLYY
jgi:hypothetical protein